MKRRDFLRYLLSTPVAAFVDYEKLLWVPGEKKIFVPSERVIIPGVTGHKRFLISTQYGIPYHMCSSISDSWMGIDRIDVPTIKIP